LEHDFLTINNKLLKDDKPETFFAAIKTNKRFIRSKYKHQNNISLKSFYLISILRIDLAILSNKNLAWQKPLLHCQSNVNLNLRGKSLYVAGIKYTACNK